MDRYLEGTTREVNGERIRRAAGMWKDREDLPDFDAMRLEWERHPLDAVEP